ncbi:MAG: HlyD family efflux transporter periplasmic adaptor subunit, partial [Planctomycetota bacterium]
KAEEEALAAAKATLDLTKNDHDRKLALLGEGLTAVVKYQEAEQKYLKAIADVARTEAKIEDAEAAVREKQSERSAKENELKGKLDEARAKVRKAEADVAKAKAEVQKAESEVQKANQNFQKAESELAKQRRGQIIEAPADGFVTNLISDGGSALVKKGDPLFTLVPDVTDRAVQIWLDGNDAPLVTPGRHVRLQFEGWPAVQTVGWPSAAVGTFGGTVATVDAVDDGNGRFRALVVPEFPDASVEDGGWPEPRFLKFGVRTNGWVLLEQVTLGYETWRRMNGFPPVLKDAPGSKDGSSPKPVKMSKQK